jgi:hypothetical protein
MRKRKFSFVRVFLFFLFFVLVVGGFFAVKMMESFSPKFLSIFLSKGLKTKILPSDSSDFLATKNQTNETKKEETANETMPKSIVGATFTVAVSNGSFTNKTIPSAAAKVNETVTTHLPTTKVSATTNELQQSGNEPQSKEPQSKNILQKKKMHVKPILVEKHLARSSSKKETIEKKLSQENTSEKKLPPKDTLLFNSEEKTVEKKENFSLFQGEKKLENLLLKAEEETAKGNYQLAKFFYEKYLEEKKDPQVYNNYGGVLFLLGDYEGAEKAFATALSLEQNPVFKLNLILTKIKRNQTKEACQMFKKFQKELETLKEVAFVIDICFF